MNREDIIRMAREAGGMVYNSPQDPSVLIDVLFTPETVERFTALVAAAATEEANRRANASWSLMCEKMVAAEREACAKVCDALHYEVDAYGAQCAAAIRARGQA